LVAGTVARMLGSSSDVEDIAQQVFIRVWKSARRYVPRAKFTTWLLKITRNLVFNEMRRTKRRPNVPLQSEPGTEGPPVKDETTSRSGRISFGVGTAEAIEEAIQRLPEPSEWRSCCAGIKSSATNKSQRSSISPYRR
jgi:RNA polymerase sigma-70 factor (ECF subfamily)